MSSDLSFGAAAALSVALLACGGCRDARGPAPPDDAALGRMRRESEARLAGLGRGVFEVVRFTPKGSRRIEEDSGFDLADQYWEIEFEADVRCAAAWEPSTQRQLIDELGAPGWTRESTEKKLAHKALLGARPCAAGETRTIAGAAFFEARDRDWPFFTIDKRR